METKTNESRTNKVLPFRDVFFSAQVDAVMQAGRRALVINIGLAIIVAIWLAGNVSLPVVGNWLIYMIGISAGTSIVLSRYLQDHDREGKARNRIRQIILACLLLGGGWGSLSFIYFPESTEDLGLLLAMILGLTGLSTTVLSPIASVFWAFALAAILPFSIQYLIESGGSYYRTSLILGGYLFMFGFAANHAARRARTVVREKVIILKEVQSRRIIERQLVHEKQMTESVHSQRRNFTRNFGLEIRNYLTPIIGFSEILKRDREGKFAVNDLVRLEKINRNGRQIVRVIDNVLDLADIEEHKPDLDLEPVAIRNLIDEVLELQQDALREKQLTVSRDVAEDVPDEITTDSSRLWQIFNNLMHNAVKLTDQGSVGIRVELQDKADHDSRIRIAVSDSCGGIDEDLQEKLFNPFARQGDGGPIDGGVRLALAITRNLVRLLGGELVVSSKPGEGATFSFTLPVVLQESDADSVQVEEES